MPTNLSNFCEVEEENIEIENESDLVTDKNLFSQAVIWGTDWTVETINNQLNKGNIDLNPKFQRRNAWSFEKKSKLIESLILGLPVPEIILAENKKKKGSYIVIDGKQRLLAIRQFFSSSETEEFPHYKLKSLEILKDLVGKTYADFEKQNLLNPYKEALDNQSIRTIIIKNWPNDDFLYTVFHRLNTGSVQLSPQELRQALHPGPFIDFAEQFSRESQPIRNMLRLKEPDSRMRDVELVIHFFAFKNFLNRYRGRFKNFMDTSVEALNVLWTKDENLISYQAKELEDAINVTTQIFGENAFRKYSNGTFKNLFNRTVFEIMVYYFSDEQIRKSCLDKKTEIKNAFIDLCESDPEFLRSLEIATKNLDKVVKRFSSWGLTLARITSMDIQVPKLKDGKIELVDSK
jgi:hypothetical protein